MSIVILSGMRLTPARLNALAPATARRTTDLTVTNSAALVDALSLPLVANAEYDVDVFAMYEAHASGDIRLGFAWSTGSMVWGSQGLVTTGSTTSGDLQPFALGAPASDATFGFGGAGLGNQLTAQLRGTLLTGGAAGTLRLRMAQNVATAAASAIVKAGSTMQLRRIA